MDDIEGPVARAGGDGRDPHQGSARVRRGTSARLRPAAAGAPRAAGRAAEALRRRRAAGVPRRDGGRPRRATGRSPPTPPDLQKRWVEITGPVERKMMINALNSGASVFMADFEDSLSPTWTNIVQGQQNLKDAVRRTIAFTSPEGKDYRLTPETATLLVRPRGWHLAEKHVLVDGAPVSREPLRLRPLLLPQRVRAEGARQPVPTSTSRRWRATSRRACGTTSSSRRRRASRSRRARSARPSSSRPPGRLRDGRDPLRAAGPHERPERRALGLHLQPHQEAARARGRPPRPRAGHDDGAVHARLQRAPGEDVPPPRRARDGRHGAVHPDRARTPR